MRRYRYRTDGRALHTEDYELFSRMLIDGVAMENLDMPLYGIRVRPGSVSRRFEKVQIANFVQCAARYLEETTGEWRGAGPHRVLVNRMDASTRASHLRSGLVWLRELESGFCAAEDGCEDEIRRIADQQRVDILIQALRRGRASVRLAAAGLMARYVRSFASGAGRRYLASKLRAATLTRGELEG
jgi:hypothetical protein